MNNYYYKYLKYKNKYIELQKLSGGAFGKGKKIIDDSDSTLISNILDSFSNESDPKIISNIADAYGTSIDTDGKLVKTVADASASDDTELVSNELVSNELAIHTHFNILPDFYKYVISSHGESSEFTFIIPPNIELYFFSIEGSCLFSINQQQTKICNNTLTEEDFKVQKKDKTFLFHKYSSGEIINNYKLSKDRASHFKSGIVQCSARSNVIIYDIARLHTSNKSFLFLNKAIQQIVEWHLIEFLKKNINIREELDMYIEELDKLEEPIRVYCLFCRV